jgi:hypothetical protein
VNIWDGVDGTKDRAVALKLIEEICSSGDLVAIGVHAGMLVQGVDGVPGVKGGGKGDLMAAVKAGQCPVGRFCSLKIRCLMPADGGLAERRVHC